jgi:chromosome partitioning protein
VVKNQELAFRRQIPAAILFTRTNAAIRPRTLKSIETEFRNNGLTIFDVQLHERDAFRAIFAFGGTLSELPLSDVSNIPAAISNARAFAGEVVALLKRGKPSEQRREVA